MIWAEVLPPDRLKRERFPPSLDEFDGLLAKARASAKKTKAKRVYFRLFLERPTLSGVKREPAISDIDNHRIPHPELAVL